MSVQQLSEKRLERAVDYVSDYWFPANPRLVDRIRRQLSRNDHSPEQFLEVISTVKQDFSLFLFVFRELVTLLRKQEPEIEVKLNPVELMHWAGAERLGAIFDAHDGVISRHRIEDGDSFQAGRLQEMFVSVSCAEVLAESYHLDADAAYSAAVIRQLGHVLIAWNYPVVYQKAMNELSREESLDMHLAKKLGFSPALLALRVVNSWGVEESYGATLGLEIQEYQNEENYVLDAMGHSLAELCRVGECLAKASQPDRYPDTADNWFAATEQITARLGASGLRRIQERVREVTTTYFEIAPEIFNLGLLDRYCLSNTGTQLIEVEGNPFLDHCLPHVSRRVFELYREIKASGGSGSAGMLQKLVFDVVPSASFLGGIIYTADPGLMHLMPQMEFGKIELRSTQVIDYSIVLSNADMVSLAFQSVEPVAEYQMARSGKIIEAIAGMFGRSQKVGVLYLEIPHTVSDCMRNDRMTHFQAIRHLLNDCLGLT